MGVPEELENPAAAHDRGTRTPEIGSLVHVVNLEAACGTENYCVEMTAELGRRFGIHNHLSLVGERVHPAFRPHLSGAFESVWRKKHWRGLRVPKALGSLRERDLQRFHRRADADAHLVWNTGPNPKVLADARTDPAKTLYFERGMAWQDAEAQRTHAFFDEVRAILCNSHAGRRMLELRHGVKQTPVVVRNGLQPRARPATSQARAPVEGRSLRLGVASRLVPLKGVPLAVHALRHLRDRGRAVELHVAGEGPEAAALRKLADELGVGGDVHLHGHVSDMSAFFASIDVLVHTALREPSSNSLIEAAAHGCPVVAARVDGVPELVVDGETGILVDPRLDLARYPDFGGPLRDLPRVVYDPARDTLREPGLCDPDDLADAVDRLANDPDRYVRTSAAAIAHVQRDFDFGRRAGDLIETIARSIGPRNAIRDALASDPPSARA